MGVLVEALSVVVRRDVINTKIPRGWNGFVECVPNGTLCTDDELARVGFCFPDEVRKFLGRLEEFGLVFLNEGKAKDMAVVDQQTGPTTPVDWLEFAHFSIDGNKEHKVAVCWLFDGPREGAGLHFRGRDFIMVTPPGWTYENSLSAKFTFVPTEEIEAYLRNKSQIQ